MDKKKYNDGLQLIDKLFGEFSLSTRQILSDEFADVENYITEFSFGDIYMRDGLELKIKEIITLTVLISIGASKEQLRLHLYSLIRIGLSKKEIAEVIIQTLPNVGFPKVIDAIVVAKTVFGECS